MNAIAATFGPLGTREMIVVAILVLVLFGWKKLPTFARSLGRSLGEFRRAKEAFEQELMRSVQDRQPFAKRDPASPENQWAPLDMAMMTVVVISAAMLAAVVIYRLMDW